jgi:hypothetical protein
LLRHSLDEDGVKHVTIVLEPVAGESKCGLVITDEARTSSLPACQLK